jgi:hypothetical protein
MRKPNPADGLTFTESMLGYGPEDVVEEWTRLTIVADALRRTGRSLPDQHQLTLDTREYELVQEQLERLFDGIQRATGVPPQSLTAVDIPREHWRHGTFDRDENTLTTASGVVLTGVLIYPGGGVTAAAATTRAMPKHEQVTLAITRDLEKGVHTGEEIWGNQERAAGFYGVDRGTYLRARDNLPPSVVRIYRVNC